MVDWTINRGIAYSRKTKNPLDGVYSTKSEDDVAYFENGKLVWRVAGSSGLEHPIFYRVTNLSTFQGKMRLKRDKMLKNGRERGAARLAGLVELITIL